MWMRIDTRSIKIDSCHDCVYAIRLIWLRITEMILLMLMMMWLLLLLLMMMMMPPMECSTCVSQ